MNSLHSKFMNNLIYRNSLIILFAVFFLSSCKMYYSNRMFRTKDEILVDSIQKQMANANANYIIQKSDYLSLQVYTNGGEILIDPNSELSKDQTSGKAAVPRFLVRGDGNVALPMVGDVYLVGYTVKQADSILALQYSKFYKEVFVMTRLLNKRVIVLGPAPIGGKIIILENENINLIEVLAMSGGINEHGKAYNIRLIRGDLKNPNVNIINLSTIEGMKAASLNVYPNDIIYVEQVRPIISETFREISPIISILTTVLTLIILFR